MEFIAWKKWGYNNFNCVTLKTDSNDNSSLINTIIFLFFCQIVFSFISCVINKVQMAAACLIQASMRNNNGKSNYKDPMKRNETVK